MTPGTVHWDDPNNWVPNTVPNSVDDVATFGSSSITAISVFDIDIGAIVFQPGASAYTFTTSGVNNGLRVLGAGITNDSGMTQNFIINPPFGSILFSGSSTAGSNTVLTANPGRFAGENGATVSFYGTSNAGSGTFTAVSEQVINGFAGEIEFSDESSAADATVTAQGSSVNGGATVVFEDRSIGGNATLIAESGSDSGDGGVIDFGGNARGGTMRVILFGDGTDNPKNGHLAIGPRQNLIIGSIEGGGQIHLSNVFGQWASATVGSNNLSTTFDGVILGFFGNSVTKTGTGTLTLTNGANTYTGGTNVNRGTLLVSNATGLGAGGPIKVNAGTLGGSGTVAGPVTIGTGNGTGAFLAPAHGTRQQATFTIQNSLTFKADSTYTYTAKAKPNRSRTDKVVAGGVAIESGATFSLRATIQGTLIPGTVFTAISNTSVTPIAGTFSNLPDGGLITVGGTAFQADYEGGDGNDLTLTVVP
jgi:autotransporter-associated beta strand protein